MPDGVFGKGSVPDAPIDGAGHLFAGDLQIDVVASLQGLRRSTDGALAIVQRVRRVDPSDDARATEDVAIDATDRIVDYLHAINAHKKQQRKVITTMLIRPLNNSAHFGRYRSRWRFDAAP